MKARAICLEIFVEMSDAEFKKLGTDRVLNNVLRFSSNVDGEEDDYIPMEIRLVSEQREDLKVEQTPHKVYFGNAENISFRINQEFYDVVEERGMYGDRFYGAEGKLIIQVKDR